ncbi:MAG: TIGR00730 family Rossman fold protein [Bacteroidales bacterium]|nr:TIGR00730 family Rossman fold protein [Bacteroidales bacterium]
MKNGKNICIYCASSMGNQRLYADTAKEVGVLVGRMGFNLLYGGACCGTMGVVADAALANGAFVHGVIPDFFEDYDFEVVHPSLPKLTKVKTMAERKERLIRDADIFLTLPGSYGTLDELFETLVLVQLKQIDKPVLLLNTEGFFDALLQMLQKMQDCGFLQPLNRQLLRVVNTTGELERELRQLM